MPGATGSSLSCMRQTPRHLLAGAAAVAALAMVAPSSAQAQRSGELAPNAPKDKPVSVAECQMRDLARAIEALALKARATLPDAVTRFRAGLPRGETFFVTTRLVDSVGRKEQIFVAVDSAPGQRLVGRIWSEVVLIKGYRNGQRYDLRQDAVIDWMISKPDGSEEGNEVGKFLDTYRPPNCRDSARSAGSD